jgi:hypothetical protein
MKIQLSQWNPLTWIVVIGVIALWFCFFSLLVGVFIITAIIVGCMILWDWIQDVFR